jgi:hypothetical protein
MRFIAVFVAFALSFSSWLPSAASAERTDLKAYHARIRAEAKALNSQPGYFEKDPFASSKTLPNWAQATVFFSINSAGKLIRGPEIVTLGNKNVGNIVGRELSAAIKKTASINWQLPPGIARRTLSMTMLVCKQPPGNCPSEQKVAPPAPVKAWPKP